MCDLNGPFRLCTCSDDIDYSKPHWILRMNNTNEGEDMMVNIGMMIPSSFIRIRFSSEGQSILLISNTVLFILVFIFVSKRFNNYSYTKNKTVRRRINFWKFWIVVWW